MSTHIKPNLDSVNKQFCITFALNNLVYRWKFNLFKVVRQLIWGVVGDFIQAFIAVHLRMW